MIKNIILFLLGVAAAILVIRATHVTAAQTTWPSGPWWYSNHPEIVAVASTGAMTAVSPGQAVICVQPSVSITKPTQCFLVNVVQIVK